MKKIASIICIVLLINASQAQNVIIPDTIFFNALITAGIDTSGDHTIQTAEALAVTSLSVGSMSIKDLTGIEAFTNLTSLACPINSIKSVDFSKNTLLQYIDIGGNYVLTTLDLSKNTDLRNLDIIYTGLTAIDLSHNLLLEGLSCSGTVYGGLTLKNRLKSLDVSKNTLLNYLSADLNLNLHTICVNADQLANKVAGWSKDANCVWDTCAAIVSPPTSINELNTKNTPQLIRCITILGNEIDPNSSSYEGIVIYYFSDGSTKKVLKME